MITKFAKKEEFYDGTSPRNWWIIDATGKTLGRMATKISHILRSISLPLKNRSVGIYSQELLPNFIIIFSGPKYYFWILMLF